MKKITIGITFLVGLFFISWAFPSCTQTEEATRVLKAAGYTDIEMTGYRPLMGGEDDVFSTGFRAKSPNGTTVTGAVTKGPFKGNTIRLD